MQPDATTIDKLFTTYGVSGTLIVMLVWGLVKYGPRLIEAHISFVQAVQNQGVKVVDLNEEISERQKYHAMQTQQALDAIRHSCNVIETFARGSPHEAEIKQQVATMRDILSGRTEANMTRVRTAG